jgi:hypothetical protein
MSAIFVDRAIAGRCVICERKLPKRTKIILYTAHANLWTKGVGEDCREVEVAVCGKPCYDRYSDGEMPK